MNWSSNRKSGQASCRSWIRQNSDMSICQNSGEFSDETGQTKDAGPGQIVR